MTSPDKARRIAAGCEPGSYLERFWLETADVETANETARQRVSTLLSDPEDPFDLVEDAPAGSAQHVCEDGSVAFDDDTWPSWASRPRKRADLTDMPFLKKDASDAERADYEAFKLHRERVWRAFKALAVDEQATIKADLAGEAS